MRIRCILLIFFFIQIQVFAQRTDSLYSKWNAEPGFGLHFGLTHLKSGQLPDALVGYQDQGFLFQTIFGSFYFNENFAAEFYLQYIVPFNSQFKNNALSEYVTKTFSGQHFVTENHSAYSYSNGEPVRGLIGATYRYCHGRFQSSPKAYIGFTSFNNAVFRVDLKERNSNFYHTYTLNPSRFSSNYFTVAAGISESYRLSKRFLIRSEILYSYFKSDLSYEEIIEDLFTSNITTRSFTYKKGIHSLTVGLGITFEIKLKLKKPIG